MPLSASTGTKENNAFIPEQVQSARGAQPEPRWDDAWDANKGRRMSIAGPQGESVESTIDKADIQNPSDALEILAQVAGGEHSGSSSAPPRSVPLSNEPSDSRSHRLFSDFPPFVNGFICYQDMLSLFDR